MVNYGNLAFALPLCSAFKNFDRSFGTISISGTIAAGTREEYTDTVDLKRDNGIAWLDFSTTVNSFFHNTSQTYAYLPGSYLLHLDGSTPTFPGLAGYVINIESNYSGQTATITASIFNSFAEILTPVAEDLSFDVYTFISPYKS